MAFPPILKKAAALSAGGLAAALGFALLSGRPSFGLAFGDALMVESFILISWAWFGYLRKDGIRIFPSSRQRSAPESWKDRIPIPGSPPLPARSMPGPEGPGSEDYARLTEAEDALRTKILGQDEEKKTQTGRGRATVAAAILLFLVGLLFEFALPF